MANEITVNKIETMEQEEEDHMGNFLNTIKNVFSAEPNEDVLAEESKVVEAPKPNSTIRTSKVEYNKPKTYPTPQVTETSRPSSPAVSSVNTVKAPVFKSEKASFNSKLFNFEPKTIDDAKKVIEYLHHGYAVILNLENIDNALSQRLVDVVSGALYLLDGTYQVVTDDIYLMAPKGVEINSPLNTESVTDSNVEKTANASSFSFKK